MRWIAGSAIVFLSTTCWAQEKGEFKDLVGVWAHTSAACSDYTSGKVDRLPDRVSKTPYELIGICTNGVELLYQPVGCRTNASNVEGVPRVEVDSLCSVKDYAPKGGHFRIEATVRTRSHSMSRTLLATSRSRATTSAASATTYVATG
jgi:hypothetical protein